MKKACVLETFLPAGSRGYLTIAGLHIFWLPFLLTTCFGITRPSSEAAYLPKIVALYIEAIYILITMNEAWN
jgi:hypothetical protein